MMIDYYLRIYDDVESLKVDLGFGFMQKLASVRDEPEWNCLVVKISNNLILFYVGTPQERANALFNVSNHARLTSKILIRLGFTVVNNRATRVPEFIVKNYLVFGEERAYEYFSADEYRQAFHSIGVPCPEKVMVRLLEEALDPMMDNAQMQEAANPVHMIQIVPELFPEPDVEEDDWF